MWTSVVVFCVVVALAKGQGSTEVSQCLNFPGDLPLNTDIEGCVTPPCQLPQLQDVVLHLTFRAPYTVHKMTTYARAYLSIGIISIPVDYPLEDNAITCNFLTNTYCPVLRGEIVQYTLRMYIESFFPVGTAVTIEFRVVDDNEVSILCLRVPVRIVDPVAGRISAQNSTLTIDQQWCCSICTSHFQTYHEAQFHVKSHAGEQARPKEAVRDPAMRSAWVTTAIQTQKEAIKTVPLSPAIATSTPEKIQPENDNSLLVVRYEENVTTPEDTMPVRRKRSAPNTEADGPSQKKGEKSCEYCDYKTKYYSSLMDHVPRHFNLKPYTCGYCDFSSYRQGVVNHIEKSHRGYYPRVNYTIIPPELIANFKKSSEEEPKLICLFCEKSIPENETDTHLHDNIKPEFAKKGDVVVKCCICLVLRIDVKSLQEHHNSSHPDIPINYALFKLHHDTRETNYCGYCNKGFKYIRDLKTHHNAVHSSFQLMYTSAPYTRQGSEEAGATQKRCARKSTTKLPNVKSAARKSTTKLPDSDVGYSYYNTRPSLDKYADVTTMLPVCNTMMPFTFKKLKEFIKVEPKVLVKDIQSVINNSSDK